MAAKPKKKAKAKKPAVKTGRPAKYATPEELQAAVDDYFASCKPEFDKAGNIISHNSPKITGLALALGFCDRQSLYDYEKRGDAFSCIIKKARLTVESHYEENLNTVKATGSIFALKNMGWKDKVEAEVGGKDGGPININVRFVDKADGK